MPLNRIVRPTCLLAVLAILASATPLTAQGPSDCSTLGQTTYVRDVLDFIYFWYQELPDLDPALFDSPEAYLDAVRFRPLDESFSYITSAAASDAFYSSSEFIGIGFSFRQTGPLELRVSQVFPESPASESGMKRGDFLVAVDGRPVSELLETGQLNAALGPSEVGFAVTLSFRPPGGEVRSARVVKRVVGIPTVSQTAVFDVNGLPVGYLHLRNFVEPSVAALDAAFADFQARGVTDLILDLRYNGGGLVSVSQHLGGLIGGLRTNSRVFVELVYSDKNSFLNQEIRFGDPAQSLDLPRVVIITTRSSASASELVVNGLRPFVPVTVVGDATYGKPVGQLGFEFCEKILFPVSFTNRNAEGQGDFFDGIPADCTAADDLEHPLASREEASLAEALHFLGTGACSPRAPAAARRLDELRGAERTALFSPRGFRQLLNAW